MTRRLIVMTLLLLGGCAAGPEYVPPAPRPAAGAPFRETSPALAAGPAPATWATLFHDPALDALVADALAANADLRVASANLRRVQALSEEARAGRMPQTTARGAVDVDQSTPDPDDDDIDTFDAALDIAYQIDLTGRIRRTIEAARADAEAERATLEAVRITVAAETARAYIDACGAARQFAIAGISAGLQSHTVDIVDRRHREGAVSGLDLAQARAQLAQTRAETPRIAAKRAAALNRLALLTGRAPSELPPAASACASAPRVSATIPVGDGAALLARRPDVRAAERRLAAATARIGVAKADYYPQVRLGLSAGAGGETSSDIGFKWSISPLVTWTFPNRAVVRAKLAQSTAGAEAALANWDKATLTALQEVDTALTSYARELDRNAELVRAGAAADDALRRAQVRYREGAESYSVVLDVQQRKAEVDALLAACDTAVANRQVDLFLALGGGWT